ncbi:hypothetical protein R5H30_13990 [Sulfitobacter sp. D35]|uniref:hypothetical protein n=1 Tax=Sulfitobacter sp. D35 TaxID=3083252 RepID=UPI00296E7C32|nr:hypothetical protein [Sulfitobacter sp. D35]MDW4499103.1 hypothetical protein [Sulfitobacter sp. D35]
MSYQPKIPGLFAPEQGALPIGEPLPATEKQVRFAHQLALRTGDSLPEGITRNRQALSRWIDQHNVAAGRRRVPSDQPSSKQVAFAERIARIRRREIPRECFHDRGLMSKWIDSNKP